MNVRLGYFFTLEEMTRTDTGFENEPNVQVICNLTRLVATVLDPLRREVGPLRVTSGYRSHDVNEAVGGAEHSYHVDGLAADIISDEHTTTEIAYVAGAMGLPYDKLINEYGRWIHVQVPRLPELPRNKNLVASLSINGRTTYREV